MKPNFILFAVAATAPCLASTNAQQPALEMNADGEVQIAPDGSVSDYRLRSQLAPAVATLIDQRVRTWRFVPVLMDGKPVVAKSAMHLALRAMPLGTDQYRLEVANVTFGGPKAQPGFAPPKYPEAAIRGRVGAKVLLYLKLDDAGKVTDVQPYQTSLDARANSEVEAEKYRKMFEEASIRAARHWQYDLTETINGKKVGTVAITPIVYSLHGYGLRPPGDGERKAYLPGPIHEVPWAPMSHALSPGEFAGLGNGEFRSLNSQFQLRDDVIEKAL